MKNKLSLISTFLLFGAIVALMGYAIIRIALKPQRPLTNADIPQSTLDWFEGLIDGGSDIGGILGPENWDPDQWNSYEDIDSMHRIEDDLFVIYYSSKDSVVERNKALVTQRYAHEAVPVGELFMKKYPYPDSLNGRKLPIYLAKTVDDLGNICEQLGHRNPGTGLAGIFLFQFGVNNVFTDGIVISPVSWKVRDSEIDPNTKDEFLKEVLWHEMNHFMYFCNWDYTQTDMPFLWFTEGLADYFSGFYEDLLEIGNYKRLNLNQDFRGNNTEYWGGMTAYLCLEQKFNKSKVSDVVSNSYKNSIEKAVKLAIPNYSLKSWNNDWHTFMENKEYKKYMH
jgi:hypothetical protein